MLVSITLALMQGHRGTKSALNYLDNKATINIKLAIAICLRDLDFLNVYLAWPSCCCSSSCYRCSLLCQILSSDVAVVQCDNRQVTMLRKRKEEEVPSSGYRPEISINKMTLTATVFSRAQIALLDKPWRWWSHVRNNVYNSLTRLGVFWGTVSASKGSTPQCTTTTI